jgi:hypothetical protein
MERLVMSWEGGRESVLMGLVPLKRWCMTARTINVSLALCDSFLHSMREHHFASLCQPKSKGCGLVVMKGGRLRTPDLTETFKANAVNGFRRCVIAHCAGLSVGAISSF